MSDSPMDSIGPLDAGLEYDPLSRRKFVKVGFGLFGACYAGALGYPIYRYLNDPAEEAALMAAITEVSLDAASLDPGSVLMFRFGARPAMLIHHLDGSWASFDAVCTHLGCTVQYETDKNRIHCACHGGVYDPVSGHPVSGPPPRSLRKYNVEVKDAQVIVSRA
ncbi:MAG: Rieske (2Fe-2S) protein [Candidatus Omnitrophica bacterium]|nr:Rieske (2Fe-2S) protein [Candidatus Omnitrophota bacterium]MCA9429333.1 Rieske (2Fe-2S) protein [Candidatus Omnitrophota bacterium]